MTELHEVVRWTREDRVIVRLARPPVKRLAAPVVVGLDAFDASVEWTEGRRYLGLDALTRARAAIRPDTAQQAATLVPALSA